MPHVGAGAKYLWQGSVKKGVAEYTLLYDFQPHHSSCPLLLCSPRPLKQEVTTATLNPTKSSRKGGAAVPLETKTSIHA